MKIHRIFYLCSISFCFPICPKERRMTKMTPNSWSPVSKECLTEIAIHDGFNSNFLFLFFPKICLGCISIGPSLSHAIFMSVLFHRIIQSKIHKKGPVWSFKFFSWEYTCEFLSEFKMVRRLIHITYHILVKLFICLITFLLNIIPKRAWKCWWHS